MASFAPTVSRALEGVDGLIQSVPAIGAAQNVFGLANVIRNTSGRQKQSQQNIALEQLKQKQQLQQRQLLAQNNLKREKIEIQAQANEEKRLSALRRAVARQRASFGARGVGNSGGGSSQAVLLGLFEESEEEKQRRGELDGIRASALDLSQSKRASINILQRTQLQERQRFDRALSGGNRFGGFGGLF